MRAATTTTLTALERRLRLANLRPTRQRLALARLLFENGDRRVTADQLHMEALEAGVRLSLSTVYNTLYQFADSGLLHELPQKGGIGSHFDTNTAAPPEEQQAENLFDTLSNLQQQRPAAYRFRLREDKVDVLPEPPETVDRAFAVDTYEELIVKAQELLDRLRRSNSQRACSTVERLLNALGTNFDDLRPGVLLSRSRSLEADRAAFGDELFSDAIAIIDDTLKTLHDLMAAFPILRRIEAEGLALQLDRSPDAIPVIQQEMVTIETEATQLGTTTEEALSALRQNDAAIEDAVDPILKRSLIADKLLVFGNFTRAVLGGIASRGRQIVAELGEPAGKSWQAVKEELPKGVGTAARVAPIIILMTLAGVIAGPVGSIASAVPAFKPVSNALKNLIKDVPKDTSARVGKDDSGSRKSR